MPALQGKNLFSSIATGKGKNANAAASLLYHDQRRSTRSGEGFMSRSIFMRS